MLFKYLMAPVVFAVAAASVPSYGEPSVSKSIDFEPAITATLKYRQPITSACAQEKVQEVISDLTEIYTPVAEVSEKFHSSVEKYEHAALYKQAQVFFGFLQSFQAILKVISEHPKVYQGCNQRLPDFDTKFSVIITEFKKYNIDLHSAFGGVKLDVSLWYKFGFKFQRSLGY